MYPTEQTDNRLPWFYSCILFTIFWHRSWSCSDRQRTRLASLVGKEM